MKKLLTILALLTIMSGCVSFKSSHGQFIDNMETIVINATYGSKTVEEYATHSHFLYKKYLQEIEKLDDQYNKYHYKLPRYWGDCYYYFLVERSTNIPVDWGFDEHLGDPAKTCGSSG